MTKAEKLQSIDDKIEQLRKERLEVLLGTDEQASSSDVINQIKAAVRPVLRGSSAGMIQYYMHNAARELLEECKY